MKIETTIPDGFYEAFNHPATPELWGRTNAGAFIDMVDDLVIKDIIAEPETYRGGSEHEYAIHPQPFSVHVPSANAYYEKCRATNEDPDEKSYPVYQVGLYSEMTGDSEWFTVCGTWHTWEVGAYFGYCTDAPHRMVVLFS